MAGSGNQKLVTWISERRCQLFSTHIDIRHRPTKIAIDNYGGGGLCFTNSLLGELLMLSTLHLRVFFLVLALALVTAPIARGEPAKTLSKPEDLELITTLIQKNHENLAKIKTYRVEFESSGGGKLEVPLPNGTLAKGERTHGQGYYLRSGNWYRFDFSSIGEVLDQTFKQESRRMAVLNPPTLGYAKMLYATRCHILAYDEICSGGNQVENS